MPITELLSRNADMYGNETCLVEINLELQERDNVIWKEYELIENNPAGEYRRDMTWRVFEEKANRLANLLIKRGIKKGDKVAILLMNCLEWLPIYFGILKSGAVAVPLNFRYTAEEIKYCLELSGSSALIFGPEFIGRLENIYEEIPQIKLLLYAGENRPSFAESYDRLTANCSSEPPQVDITDADDAAIYFSSGTTGFPKAILHSHGSLLSACYTEQNHHRQTREDNFLCIPPLYHTGAKMHWFGSLLSGSKAILLRGIKPDWILRTVSEEKITIVWLLVPWAQDILDAIERGDVKLEDYQLSQWRLMHIGAQPVPPSLIQRWKKYFPNHEYDTNYGLSESCGPGCVHLGIENIHKVGAIGKPGYNWEARIVNEKGEDVAQGEVGELIVKGPGVMKCYYNDPKATAAILKDGWLYTGDMAKMDKDGFIYLVDRKKDVIISGGENIYPVQIEDFLRSHDAIKDAAVIGLPDKRLGEIATAIIELKPGMECTEEEINSFCKELPRYKRPRRIIFDKVPRNPTGKIEKPRLREKYGATCLVAAQVEIEKAKKQCK
ncbi:class I adenylate-forming enzyme family protein [Acetivibrio saccincola]|uniref:AMP-dependent synthetase n=1 Tax=Acetivibrio saccincola TaxID=1677857 RepID=A0A2K9E3X4_9FIRM|nr:class I adenylate-forming enzyme family protein [Acetivibrio saccincola]AUG58089.1 Long-chain-fatty-acid--CoA ligase [Acetivibrio saccincola]NLW26334.1 acyl--CoA ligase [Acetivibrio saccincola]PQQ67975.1 AMP-dependent synthetase [Acetivibrio saccincola]HOA96255.1 class I adenylate-forming enzyme family protein [Acetivibrio saccincola]HQD28364.1 class I adenylate-forming enzyme family protein [Acetivibrio saccincola]